MANDTYRLFLLKNDLNIQTDKRDTYFSELLKAAEFSIAQEGIILSQESDYDDWLVASYAAFLYRKRTENVSMPRMLRYNLNNRLFSQKGRVNDD